MRWFLLNKNIDINMHIIIFVTFNHSWAGEGNLSPAPVPKVPSLRQCLSYIHKTKILIYITILPCYIAGDFDQ